MTPAAPAVTLRPATPADALCLGVLATQVFLDTYATQGISADLALEALQGYSPAFFAQRLAQPEVTLWLAEHAVTPGGEPVAGPAGADPAPPQPHVLAFVELQAGSPCPVQGAAQDLELVRLYVQQPFQGLGLGRRLLRLAEAQAPAQTQARTQTQMQTQAHPPGPARLWLTAWDGNHRARAFYSRCGWADVGATRHVIQGRAYGNRVFVGPGQG